MNRARKGGGRSTALRSGTSNRSKRDADKMGCKRHDRDRRADTDSHDGYVSPQPSSPFLSRSRGLLAPFRSRNWSRGHLVQSFPWCLDPNLSGGHAQTPDSSLVPGETFLWLRDTLPETQARPEQAE